MIEAAQNRGQLILEVIVALAIFSLIAATLASLALGSAAVVSQGGNQTGALAYAEEGMEAVRAIRDHAWNRLRFATSGVDTTAGYWEFRGEGTIDTSGNYTRTIVFDDVCRASSGDIAACPALYNDPHAKKASVNVSWQVRPGVVNEVVQSGFITNWDSRDWAQTDWSGGAGQAIWSDASRYDAASTSIDAATAGEIKLGSSGDGAWSIGGGADVTDTADSDFNRGTFADTTVVGSGEDGKVTLSFGSAWVEHADSELTNRDFLHADIVAEDDIWAGAENGEIYHYDGASWSQFTDVGGENVEGLYMVNAGEGWAVGERGKIWFYDGISWTEFTDTGRENWNDVACVSDSLCFAGASGGWIAEYNGISWSESRISAPSNIYALHANSSSDVWAVGSSGRIWHYDGASWALYTDTGSDLWYDVVCTATDNCKAAGRRGAIASYNGASWSVETTVPDEDIQTIYALSSTDIWAAGFFGNIWHYDGSAWSLDTDTGNEHWQALVMHNTGGFVMGRNGEIFEFGQFYPDTGTFESRILDSGEAGTEWNLMYWTEVLPSGADIKVETRTGETPTPDGTWDSWSFAQSDETGSDIFSNNGRYMQYRVTLTRGASLGETPELLDITFIYGMATGEILYGVDALSSSDAWAVGRRGAIVHYDGSAWSLDTDTGGENWMDVSCTDAANCFSVSNGGDVAQYNGTSWSVSALPSGTVANGVFAQAPDDVWAAGHSGRIWHWNGLQWILHTDTGGERWNDVTCAAADNCWVVGDNGDMAHFDGVAWSTFVISPSDDILSISFVSASDAWAAGENGNIWHYDGSAWSLDTDTGGENWNGISLTDQAFGFVVGDNGDIFQYDGASWTRADSPTSRDLNDVVMVDRDFGWAAGDLGTIIEFNGAGLETEGALISSAFSLGDTSPVQVVEWDETIPACSPACAIRVQIQTAPDAGGAPGAWSAWTGAGGAGTYFTVHTGELAPVSVNGGEWVRYRAELAGDGVETPILEEIRINYK